MTPAEVQYHFLSGASAMASLAIAIFFARFRRKTGERLFLVLATAFALLAFERVLLVLVDVRDELQGFVYLIRLAAFLFLLVGIADKNRSGDALRARRRRRAPV